MPCEGVYQQNDDDDDDRRRRAARSACMFSVRTMTATTHLGSVICMRVVASFSTSLRLRLTSSHRTPSFAGTVSMAGFEFLRIPRGRPLVLLGSRASDGREGAVEVDVDGVVLSSSMAAE